MPACQGRPEGPCPDGINDASVKFSVADLFLCKQCEDFRFPSLKVSDNADNSTLKSLALCNKSANLTDTYVKSEILCFVADKGRVLAFDQLVKICTDFYKEEDILAARQVIDGVGTRLPKRQGPNKLRSTVEDIVEAVLNPTVALPEFHATNLSRLPPVDISHCDTAAILKELQGLRAEVREIRQLQAEVQDLRSKMQDVNTIRAELGAVRADVVVVASKVDDLWAELTAVKIQNDLQQNQSMLQAKPDVDTLRNNIDEARSDAVKAVKKVDDFRVEMRSELIAIKTLMDKSNHQPVQLAESRSLGSHFELLPVATDSTPIKPTAAEVVAAAVKSGSLKSTNVRRATKVTYGKAAISKLQTARIKKFVHLFVTRLDPDTTCDDVTNCVIDSVSETLDNALNKDSIKCEKLQTKFDTYASFRVSAAVDDSIKDAVINLLMSGDGWPVGVLVRRFYYSRNG